MKAYMVMYKDNDWGDFVHAESVREAKNLFFRVWGSEGEFINVRATRDRDLDNIPLTGENIVAAGYIEEWLTEHSYVCKCELCRDLN